MKRILVSVVVALYNEADNIPLLLEKSVAALQHLDYELILVDDGSTDGSAAIIKKHLQPGMKLIVLMKNYGQSAAMAAGINIARGEFIVTMDADLQNDPYDIPVMLEKLQAEDCELVAGIRAQRKDNWLRKIPSRIANKLIRTTTGVTLHDYGCTLKIFRQDIAKSLGLYGDMHRFIPVLAAMQGARMKEIPVKHHTRIHGKSKYGIGRTAIVLSDLLLILFIQKYFQRPMHLFGPPGLLMFFSGVIINGYLLVEKLQGKEIGGRPLLFLGVILLLAGLQLIIFGFVAEILMRTYYESQRKKAFRIRSVTKYHNTLK
jgi:glycosyltransferase involved in cell wall biosynthesis